MPLTTLIQDEIAQILNGLRLLMDLHRTTLRAEDYGNQVLIETLQMCQELFDSYWELLDPVTKAQFSVIWYPSTN